MLNNNFKKICIFFCDLVILLPTKQSSYSTKLIIKKKFILLLFFQFFSDLIFLYFNIILILFMEILFIFFLFFNKKYIVCFQWFKKIIYNKIIFFFILVFFINIYLTAVYLIFTLFNLLHFLNNNYRANQLIKKCVIINRNKNKFKHKIRLIHFIFLLSEYLKTRTNIAKKEWYKYSNTIITNIDSKNV